MCRGANSALATRCRKSHGCVRGIVCTEASIQATLVVCKSPWWSDLTLTRALVVEKGPCGWMPPKEPLAGGRLALSVVILPYLLFKDNAFLPLPATCPVWVPPCSGGEPRCKPGKLSGNVPSPNPCRVLGG